MQVHCNAATNKKQRLDIMDSDLSCRQIAARHGVGTTTAHRWKGRESPEDRSSRPRAVRVPAQRGWEKPALLLRRSGLTLDGVLGALRGEFPSLVRSTLHRHLAQNGLGRLPRAERETKAFKPYEPGFVHVDALYLPALGARRRFCFVAVDRATRLAFVACYDDKTKASSVDFMAKALEAFPFRVHRVLTDNGAEFAARRHGGRASKLPHPFTALLLSKGIRHRLTALYTPQTNGMAERFVGLLKAGTVKRTEYPHHAAMEADILAWCASYNRHRPHGGIKHRTPLQEATKWYKERPELFRRDPASYGETVPNLTRPDT